MPNAWRCCSLGVVQNSQPWRQVKAEMIHFWTGVVDRWTEKAKAMMQAAAEKEIAEAEGLAEALGNVGLCVAVPDILSGV